MDVINIVSLIIGVLGLLYAFSTTRQFTRGIKTGSLREIRILVNRLDEDKRQFPKDSIQFSTMHHSQQDLEGLFENLQRMFNISDKDAPR